ncbi:hypothetical protein XJ44_07885 [Thermosipho affectus]|uniref:Uncharacterized protein n=1 Tax=Thermosipho affectus TaxID=660294 RepID=A0ABX3IG16_9BACT|nr:hypothetical protein [Thermosipho affectus]ONN26774.1 hypothetical protein XJ44_07885 [Thermosipho affectus]
MLKKILVILLSILSVFLFSMRNIENPANFRENYTSLGFTYSTYFSDIWITKFGLFYSEKEDNLIGKLYLFTENASPENLNRVGYILKSVGDEFQWGINFLVKKYTNSTNEGYSFCLGVGFMSKIIDYVKLGAFVEELTLFAQSPFEFFKPDVGVDLIIGNETYSLVANFQFIKQEYFQFNVGPVLNFKTLELGAFWNPGYIINKSFFNKISGYFALRIEKLMVLLDAFYAIDRDTVSDLPMHYENTLYGYNLLFEVGF